MNSPSNGAVSANKLFGNYFQLKVLVLIQFLKVLIIQQGMEELKYLERNLAEALDFNTMIDNTGCSVIGNIIDRTVSDERLKANIAFKSKHSV